MRQFHIYRGKNGVDRVVNWRWQTFKEDLINLIKEDFKFPGNVWKLEKVVKFVKGRDVNTGGAKLLAV